MTIEFLNKRYLLGGAYDLPDEILPASLTITDSPVFYNNIKDCVKIAMVPNAFAVATTALPSWMSTFNKFLLTAITEVEILTLPSVSEFSMPNITPSISKSSTSSINLSPGVSPTPNIGDSPTPSITPSVSESPTPSPSVSFSIVELEEYSPGVATHSTLSLDNFQTESNIQKNQLLPINQKVRTEAIATPEAKPYDEKLLENAIKAKREGKDFDETKEKVTSEFKKFLRNRLNRLKSF